MATVYPIYVVSNGELMRATLNAIAILLNSGIIRSAFQISCLIGVLATAITYVRGHDLTVFFKWFILVFGINVIMLMPKMDVGVIDSSNEMAIYQVSNVPLGIGYPAHLITSVAHGLTAGFEAIYHAPDDFQYSKTGMLFGSRVFKLSTELKVTDPQVRGELNNYIKNCVIPDMLISRRYSMNDLVNSDNILTTITENTSKVRGVYNRAGEFKTCESVYKELKQHLHEDLKTNGLRNLAGKLFPRREVSTAINRLQSSLKGTYDFFGYSSLSGSALDLATQNLMISGVREGLLSYAAESNSTAALLNLSSSQAMDKMRMSMATSRNVAAYVIPIMHTTLLILMICLFPVIILLALIPPLSGAVLKNYFGTLVWIESWPLMFSALNLIVTYYTKSEIGAGGLTISNIDQLALQHSDISNMAGYLMLSIPFISGGLIKGMSGAFSTAASYIGGVMQSAASSAAAEASSGNISIGNTNLNNAHANKFDMNSSVMQGLRTQQLPSGALKTTRPDGGEVYDSSRAISSVPTNVRASETVSSALDKRAERAQSAAVEEQLVRESAVTEMYSAAVSAGRVSSTAHGESEGASSRMAESARQAQTRILDNVERIMSRDGVTAKQAFDKLGTVSLGGGVEGSMGISGEKTFTKWPEKPVGYSVGPKIGGNYTHSTNNRDGITSAQEKALEETSSLSEQFKADIDTVQEYARESRSHGDQGEMAELAQRFSDNYDKYQRASENYSTRITEVEDYRNAASYARHHASQIDHNHSQAFMDYVSHNYGSAEAGKVASGSDLTRNESLAQEYVVKSGLADSILQEYREHSSGIEPEKKYESAAREIYGFSRTLEQAHQVESERLSEAYKQESEKIRNLQEANERPLKQDFAKEFASFAEDKSELTKKVDEGKRMADQPSGKIWRKTRPTWFKDAPDLDSKNKNK